MLSAADNALLTEVSPGTPMNALMRNYWIPVLRSQRLEAGGAPVKVRLLGEDFVAYRSPDGSVGLVDERCPHRCASMSIARNEEGGLRCIFHGWKYAPDGDLIEAPTELEAHRNALMKRVRLGAYSAHEAGGMIWVFLGPKDQAPPFPAFEFTGLSPEQLDIKIAILPFNWLQNLESVLDSAHLGYLHRSSVELAMTDNAKKNAENWGTDTAPKLEFDDTEFGIREAAIRSRADGSSDVRLREVVAPFYAFLAGNEGRERSLVIAVPVDDGNSLQIHVTYNPYRPFEDGEVERIWFYTHHDKNDISDPAPGPLGWPQDREAMRNGHFSGITNRHVFYEDFAVLQSMGPVVDRRFEHLSSTDMTLVRFRKGMLKALEDHRDGKGAWGRPDDAAIYGRIRTEIFDVPAGGDWREMVRPTVA
ncbi:Rieske 2Fe-2S domain-containing protein [Novosphingobium kaempferiae]|uniref:Rieske 2Fe-2S domain-containing protein n=1 Tax=Novosphingobium kaempferiae TaxID=2896849 RepID=UPI001E2DFC74|nr:Rieske 2Fe-2S domain-containing protein [Novosphingobium kaempferiae]